MVGSAIRIGAWLPEAVEYVKSHQAALQGKTTAFFLVCLTLKDNTPENQQIVQAYLDPVRALVKPQQEGFFAGKFFYKEHSLLERLLGRVIKIPEGDFRNWDTIRAWAEQVF
jgi:menaquinone-dependent protoporphyrinogen oxidase